MDGETECMALGLAGGLEEASQNRPLQRCLAPLGHRMGRIQGSKPLVRLDSQALWRLQYSPLWMRAGLQRSGGVLSSVSGTMGTGRAKGQG